MRPDHLLTLARRKRNRPTAVVHTWECIPSDGPTVGLRLTLADDAESHPNREDVLIDRSEEDEEKARYERETGKCYVCGGDGQEWAGWHHKTGHHWRPCKRCGNTGVPPHAVTAPVDSHAVTAPVSRRALDEVRRYFCPFCGTSVGERRYDDNTPCGGCGRAPFYDSVSCVPTVLAEARENETLAPERGGTDV